MLFVTTSDLAKQKARNLNLGDATFNVDEYVAKLVTFMGGRHRGGRHNRERNEDVMDWTNLGRVAAGICRRPPTIGFMLGPLSVQKKEKKPAQRKRDDTKDIEIARPQEVFHFSFEILLICVVERR